MHRKSPLTNLTGDGVGGFEGIDGKSNISVTFLIHSEGCSIKAANPISLAHVDVISVSLNKIIMSHSQSLLKLVLLTYLAWSNTALRSSLDQTFGESDIFFHKCKSILELSF